jgi:dTDP-4-amino-4,6-dideoxygalactose transaminase
MAAKLSELGVGTSIHYPTILPCQPMFGRPDAERDFPHAAQAAREMLGLPCFPEMTDEEIDTVMTAVRQAVAAVG